MKQGNQRWRVCFEPVLKAWDEGGCLKEVKSQPKLTSPEDVETLLSWMSLVEQEIVVGVYLDAQNKVLGHEIIHVGGKSACFVAPSDIFRPAIFYSASSIVVAHNHPSGDSAPSSEDEDVTVRLKNLGELMDIILLDHLIIASGGNYSFLRDGNL